MLETVSDDRALWESLHLLNDSLDVGASKSTLEGKPKLQAFSDPAVKSVTTLSVERNVAPVSVRSASQQTLKGNTLSSWSSDGADDHYKLFVDVYGTRTTWSHISDSEKKAKTHSPNEHVAHYSGIVIQCDKCNISKWRLLLCRITIREHAQLEQNVADIFYRCGATTDDLILPDTLKV